MNIRVLGKEVATTHNYMGLDVMKREDPKYVDDYIDFRAQDRSQGYQTRARVFGERQVYLGDRVTSK